MAFVHHNAGSMATNLTRPSLSCSNSSLWVAAMASILLLLLVVLPLKEMMFFNALRALSIHVLHCRLQLLWQS